MEVALFIVHNRARRNNPEECLRCRIGQDSDTGQQQDESCDEGVQVAPEIDSERTHSDDFHLSDSVYVDEVFDSIRLKFPRILKCLDIFIEAYEWNVLLKLPHVRCSEELSWSQPIVLDVDANQRLHSNPPCTASSSLVSRWDGYSSPTPKG